MFLTLEGIEGAGKTTAAKVLSACFERAGVALEQCREPGGTPLGEQLRALLLDHGPGAAPVAPDAELMILFAARAQVLAERIRPALEAGRCVLCDRFTDATYAYQGGGRGLARERIEVLEHLVQGALRPDLTILLDVPASLGLERAGRRGAPDRFESERVEFFERVRQSYLERAAREPQRFRVIDASLPQRNVEARLEALAGETLRTLGAR